MGTYDPASHQMLAYCASIPHFLDGSSSPRAFLESCLETIYRREPTVKAFVSMRVEAARMEADAATARYKAGRPLSPIDGIPIGVKETLPTADLPTAFGILDWAGVVGPDTPSVAAAKAAGGIVLGKVTTAELGGVDPAPTTNPFDATRTPGGSSTGSGAAVGACMVPVALGTQVGGSLIRPSAFNGNITLKPTQGAIYRGDRLALSQATIGVHAGSIEDMWRVSFEIANRCGGDPGYPGLIGQAEPPKPVKPERLIVMEGPGQPLLDPRTRELFERLLEGLAAQGIKIIRRSDDARVEAFESVLPQCKDVVSGIVAYENRWTNGNVVKSIGDKTRQYSKMLQAQGDAMTPDQYRKLIALREDARVAHREIAGVGDAVIAPACLGPAPHFDFYAPYDIAAGDQPTGNWIQNAPSSSLGAPAINMPLFGIEGMPVGVQIMGQMHDDQRITGYADWILANLPRYTAD